MFYNYTILMTTSKLQHLIICFLLLSCTVNSEQSSTDQPEQQTSRTLTSSQIWGYGFLAGFGISAIGFVTALIIVCVKKVATDACFQMTIKFLFSLAFGALIGDAMIHILPDAYTFEGSDSRVVAGIFIGSILFFLILQRLFEACGITHQHWHSNDCHDDHEGAIEHHDHPNKISNEEQYQAQQNDASSNKHPSSNMIIDGEHGHEHKCKQSHNHDHGHKHKHEHGKEKSDCHGHEHEHTPTKDGDSEEEKSCLENLKGKGSAGYMNLLGSFIHNFMDGLALGVAFATGNPKAFVPILVAIIAHEIPRQMGDVAILMTNNFDPTQTVLCNGFVNLLALLGVIIGLAVADISEMGKQYILVFVAGNFIYIAADIWRNVFKNSGIVKNLVQFSGFGLGIASMYLILLLESDQER